MAWTSTHGSARDGSTSIALSEVVVDDSNKELVFGTDVGVGKYMEVQSIRIEFTATVTVGTRLLVVELLSAADDVLRQVILDANSLTASQSRTWELAPLNDPAVTAPQYVRMAPLAIHAGQKLRIRDSAAIDAAADDMVVHVHGIAR